MEGRMPVIIDLTAEAAKHTMFHGLTPQTKPAERKGSMARLGSYRDGILLLGKSGGGVGHWETHPEDEHTGNPPEGGLAANRHRTT